MSWHLWEYTGGDHDCANVAEAINQEMNTIAGTGHGPRITATAKIFLCKMNKTVPQAGIFFYHQDPYDFPPSGSKWRSQTFWTMTNYHGDLYQPMLDFLNGLDLRMALSGHVTMTNFHDGHCTLTLWYPTAS